MRKISPETTQVFLAAQRFDDPVAGEVVLGRTKPADGEHDVGARQREPQRISQPPKVVAHSLPVGMKNAELREHFVKFGAVRIDDLPEEDLSPDHDDLGVHAEIVTQRPQRLSVVYLCGV